MQDLVLSQQNSPLTMAYTSEDWRYEPAKALLIIGSQTQSLRHQAAAVLSLLCENANQDVPHSRFIKTIWNDNYLIGEKGLRNAIWEIRQLMPKRSGSPMVITAPRIGYRLSGDIRAQASGPASGTSERQLNWISAWMMLFLCFSIVWALPNATSKPISLGPEELINSPSNFEGCPAPSPDGQWLAYCSSEMGVLTRIHIRNMAFPDQPEIVIGRDNEIVNSPAWAADSKKLAYFSREVSIVEKPGEEAEIDLPVSGVGIHVFDLETQASDKLTHLDPMYHRHNQVNEESSRSDFMVPDVVWTGLAWSPDGSRFAYTAARDDNPLTGIFIYDVKTGEESRLTESEFGDDNPVWRSSGEAISFIRKLGKKNSDIFEVTLDGQVRRLTELNSGVYGYSWIPDSQSLIAFVFDLVEYKAFQIDTQSGLSHQLPIEPGPYEPVIAAGRVYYTSGQLRYDIGVSDITNADQPIRIRQLDLPGVAGTSVDIHPSEQGLLYISSESGNPELWMMGNSPSDLTRLTDLKKQVYSAFWSPDGKTIAVQYLEQTKGSESRVAYLDPETLELTEHSNQPGQFMSPLWSHDGDRLFTIRRIDDQHQLWAHDVGQPSSGRLISDSGVLGVQLGHTTDELVIIQNGAHHSINPDHPDELSYFSPVTQFGFQLTAHGGYFLQHDDDGRLKLTFNGWPDDHEIELGTMPPESALKIQKFKVDERNQRIYWALLTGYGQSIVRRSYQQ